MTKLYRSFAFNLILLTGIAGIVTPVFAHGQDANDASQSAQDNTANSRSPEAVVNRLAEKLNLTADQKNQITPIITDRQQRLSELRADTSLRRGQKMRQAKGIFEDSDKKINAILNDQQKQQYAQLEQQMRQEMKQRRQSQGGDN